MKRSQKHILSFLTAAALTVCTLPQNAPLQLLRPALTASADDGALIEGDFAYTVNADQQSVTVSEYKGEGGEAVIPDTLGGLPVTGIGSWAFFGCAALTGITIPDSVTVIGNSAFNGCTGLAAAALPSALTAIGDSAFAGCSALTEAEIPEGVTSIGTQAYSGCTALERVSIPESAALGASVFRDTPWLRAKQAENPLVVVNRILIDGTNAEGDVMIPDGVTAVGGLAFSGCQTLTGIVIPESVTAIGDSAFYGCVGLTAVTLADGLTSIGYQAFGSCTALAEITIPDSVTDLSGSVFFGCAGLTSVTLPAGLTAIGNSLFTMCSSLSAVSIPESVKVIDVRAFAGCAALTEVVLPDGTESIGYTAFAMCSALKSVTVPESVTDIGQGAFSGCPELTLYGCADSFAETYAQQFGLPFETIGDTEKPVPQFVGYAAENESEGILTAADGSKWYRVNNLEAGQDYIITAGRNQDSLMMLTACDAESGYVWRFSSTEDKKTGVPYAALKAGKCPLVNDGGQLSGDASRFPEGPVLWLYQDSALANVSGGKTAYLKYNPASETPFSFTENPEEAAQIEIYTDGEIRSRCITEQPYAESYVTENSGYAAPVFRVGTADVTPDSITWFVDGEQQDCTEAVFTAESLKNQPAGLHRVSCLVEARGKDGCYYREMSAAASFVIAAGVIPDSVLTFSDVHAQYDLIGDAIETVMQQHDGFIPALILCSGDFCGSVTAQSSDSTASCLRAALGGLDAVYTAGHLDSAEAVSQLSAAAGLGAPQELSAAGGVIFRSGSDGVQANGRNSVSADHILIYGLNYDSIRTETENGTACSYENALADLDSFLASAAENYDGELIVISAHAGLHVLGVQPGSYSTGPLQLSAWAGGAVYNADRSADMAKCINRYAEQYGMNIVYLFGHNHTCTESELLLKDGDMLISPQSFAEHSYEMLKLHFTYASTGCLSRDTGSSDARFTLLTRESSGFSADLITAKGAVMRHSEIPFRVLPGFATAEQIAEMAAEDYRQKTGTAAIAKAETAQDGTVTVTLTDKDGSLLEIYTVSGDTGIGTDLQGGTVDLPQTGVTDPGALTAFCAAVLLIASGAWLTALSLRRRKEQEI